jgi:bacterioferritin (cytochrome b1)
MQKLALANRGKLIDVLSERLAFERDGVKLYDAILTAMQRSTDPEVLKMIEPMRKQRNDEREHEEWLESQVRALGGSAHEQTELTRLVGIESSGIGKVVLDGDPEVAHLFHAILAAEAIDNAGWDVLVALADQAGDREARKAFKKRLYEEQKHLAFVKRAVERFERRQVLGQPATIPQHP